MLSINVLRFLRNWLLNHIQIQDRRLADYLIERGA